MRRKLQRKISVFLIFIVLVSIISILFLNFVLFPVSVESDSMSPVLKAHDQVFASPHFMQKNKSQYGSTFKRGDIVLLSPRAPEALSFPKKIVRGFVSFITFQKVNPFISGNKMTSQHLLRRIIGLPGDTVYISEYTVYIKPSDSQYFLTEFELSAKKYDIQSTLTLGTTSFDTTLGTIGTMEQITLNDNEYFVLCDNRISGIDSRIWGAVNEKEIEAKAVLRYFPLQEINLL